jgi:HlyD family secretion protein
MASLWYLKDGKPARIRVRTGISDGTQTEISGPEVKEGMEVIVALNQANATTAAVNPFQQQQQQGGPGGPGGGFGPPPGAGGGPR